MQSRRDQVQAYFFVVGRLVAALTHGKPDILQPPNRRLSTGTVFGFLLAALLVAVFGILGLFFPGGNESWQQPGAIIVTKETGARYVFLGGQLRPVLNYASARLAVGSSDTQMVSVSQNSLTGVPVGGPIGIPGAPDGLPAADHLDTGPWTVCVQQPTGFPTPASPTITLLIRQLSAPTLSAQQGMLVSTTDGERFVLWQGRRYRLADPVAVESLGYAGTPPMTVPASWLNPIPAGRDLTAPPIANVGRPGPMVNGQPSVVGQVYEVHNTAVNADDLYVVQSTGFEPISRTAAALLLGSPSAQAANPGGAPIEISPAALASVPVLPSGALAAGYPPTPRHNDMVAASGGMEPCVQYSPSPGGLNTAFLALPPAVVNAGAMPAGPHMGGTVADRVSITGGSGVLARDLPAPGAAPGAEYLITDVGVKYPLPDPSVAGTLGYAQTSAVAVSSQLLALLPTGPVLSPSAAMVDQAPGS